MSKDIEKLKGYLQKDEDYKKMLDFCLEPKEFRDIQGLKIRKDKLFNIVLDLKTMNALEFNNGKYSTAAFVKEHLI
jgi:hypothetical protein